MAKTTKKPAAKSELLHNTMVHHALSCAADQVKAKGILDLEPGSIPYAISCEISGELLIQQGTPAGAPQVVADIKPAEILAGITATVSESELPGMISEAILAWKTASPELRKELLARSDKVVLSAAKRRKVTKETATPARRGAVKSKPDVKVWSGPVDARTVICEIAA